MAATLEQTVAAWSAGGAAGQQKFTDGVTATTVDVVGRAIANQGAAISNYGAALSSGRWAAKLRAVGNQGWKDATVAKAANWSTGLTAGKDKYQAAMSTWLPFIQSTAAAVRTMPSGSIAASNARSAAFATALYNRKRGLA